MTAAPDSVTLSVNGMRYGGWKSVIVHRSIERCAAGFELVVSERYPRSAGEPLLINPGDDCTVKIGDDLVITGFVDDIEPGYDATSHEWRINGRSKTGRLIDCSADLPEKGQTFIDPTLRAVATALCRPHGVGLVMAVDPPEVQPFVEIEQGESAFDIIERMCRLRQVLPMDDPQGRLVINRAGTARAQGSIVKVKDAPATNVLKGSLRHSHRERFRTYIVRGQSNWRDAGRAVADASPVGRATDAAVRADRVLVLTAEVASVPDYCGKRARWEAATRLGKGYTAQFELQGWRQSAGGPLWEVNQIVAVRDDFLNMREDMLVTAVHYELSDRGTVCALTLKPPIAFQTEEPQKPNPKRNQWADVPKQQPQR